VENPKKSKAQFTVPKKQKCVRCAKSPLPPPPLSQAFKRNAAIFQNDQLYKTSHFTNGAPLGPLYKSVKFLSNFTSWAPVGPLHKMSIFIEFYQLGTPGAVTQNVKFLSNFTNGAPLGPLHKLSNFDRILQIGHPWGRYTNCRIFIEFYIWGALAAVTQTVQFLQLAPSHLLTYSIEQSPPSEANSKLCS
jgi:hypothetical protein